MAKIGGRAITAKWAVLAARPVQPAAEAVLTPSPQAAWATQVVPTDSGSPLVPAYRWPTSPALEM